MIPVIFLVLGMKRILQNVKDFGIRIATVLFRSHDPIFLVHMMLSSNDCEVWLVEFNTVCVIITYMLKHCYKCHTNNRAQGVQPR